MDVYKITLGLNFVTPSVLVDVLNHGFGMGGAVAEFFDVRYDNDMYKLWNEALHKG